MSELYHEETEPQFVCWDRFNYTLEEQYEALKKSRTTYVGNLSFFTKETQVYETFSIVGEPKRVIMGLNRKNHSPCGFCFVEFYSKESYQSCLKYLKETTCDERLIRCDADAGFLPGRQYGRGSSGGQIRDENKSDYDPGRGRFIAPSLFTHYNQNSNYNQRNNNQNYYSSSSSSYNRKRNYDDEYSYQNNKRSNYNQRNYYGNNNKQDKNNLTDLLNTSLPSSR